MSSWGRYTRWAEPAGHLAAVRRLDAREYLQQRGFAGAIGADEPQAFVLTETQGDAVEQRLQPVGLADGLGADEEIGSHGTLRPGYGSLRGRYVLIFP